MSKCRCGKAIPPYKKGTSGPEKKWCSIECCQIYRQLDVEAKKPKCICGKPIGKHKTKWCSTECNMQHHLSNLKKKRIKQKGKLTIRNCKYCGQFFMPKNRRGSVCNKDKCRKKYQSEASMKTYEPKQKVKKACLSCAETFETSDLRRRSCGKKECQEELARLYSQRDHIKIRNRLSSRVRAATVNKSIKKYGTTYELLGCSGRQFANRFVTLFQKGMSWGKFISGEIHIDHIRPCASFDLTKEEEQRKCFHWSNLQPLWAKDNMSKGAKIVNE